MLQGITIPLHEALLLPKGEVLPTVSGRSVSFSILSPQDRKCKERAGPGVCQQPPPGVPLVPQSAQSASGPAAPRVNSLPAQGIAAGILSPLKRKAPEFLESRFCPFAKALACDLCVRPADMMS